MRQGQTLVLLMVFFAVAMTVTAGAVAVIISNTAASSAQELGLLAYQIAESGAEDALIRLIRNPNFTSGGYTLTVGDGLATITVTGTGTDPRIVTSTGVQGGYERQVQITAANSGGLIAVTSWDETFP